MPDHRRQRRSVVIPARRRHRRSALRRVFYSLMLLAGSFALAVFGIGLYGYMKFTEAGPLASDKTFQIERGGGVLGIAAELEKAGIISSANVFAAAATATGERSRLKPGEYLFKQATSMRDVMAQLVSGKYITYKVTIPEGWTTAQALDRVRESEVLTGDISLTPGEGQIMPETYIVERGETRDNVVRAMMRSNERLLDDLWKQRAEDAPVKTPAEALILASIIEKETAVPEERTRVASVFANRLRLGMRLQSDPTIIYGITGGKSKLDRPLTNRDIAEATPYNTYQINGLPPGPIANPGRASISAALAPAKTKDLYFVADGSGGHVFAASLDEHRVNVRKWREIEKQRNQNGEEAPVMDEGSGVPGTTTPPAEPAPDSTAQIQQSQPVEQAQGGQQGQDAVQQGQGAVPQGQGADQGQQGNTSGMPSVADMATGEQQQGADTSPEAQVEADAGQADGTAADQTAKTLQGDAVPIPRPKPEGVVPTTTTTVAEAAPETAVADVLLDLKPGSVIKGTNRLIPIPVPKPQAP